jgi:hypothetical protein
MKMFCAVATATIVVPILAVAQEVARDITREMGVDTTTSVSQGLDRTGLHRNTETIRRGHQHAPRLLEAPQGEASKTQNPSTSKTKKLLRKRDVLLKERKAAIEVAAKEKEGPTDKPGRVYLTGQRMTADETEPGKKTERDRDANRSKEVQAIDREVQAIDRLLKQGSKGGAQVPFRAPSLINPK